jgi:hypothetical protein
MPKERLWWFVSVTQICQSNEMTQNEEQRFVQDIIVLTRRIRQPQAIGAVFNGVQEQR